MTEIRWISENPWPSGTLALLVVVIFVRSVIRILDWVRARLEDRRYQKQEEADKQRFEEQHRENVNRLLEQIEQKTFPTGNPYTYEPGPPTVTPEQLQAHIDRIAKGPTHDGTIPP